MVKIEMYSLSVAGIVIRFYLMMVVAIVLGIAGLWVPMAFIAGTIGVSAIMGVRFIISTPKSFKSILGKKAPIAFGENLKKAI